MNMVGSVVVGNSGHSVHDQLVNVYNTVQLPFKLCLLNRAYKHIFAKPYRLH